MKTHSAQNERIKRRYFTYLKEARRYSEASLDTVAKALHRFESHTRFRYFKAFHIEQPMAFKRHLREQSNVRTGKPLSKATINSTLSALLPLRQRGFRFRLSRRLPVLRRAGASSFSDRKRSRFCSRNFSMLRQGFVPSAR